MVRNAKYATKHFKYKLLLLYETNFYITYSYVFNDYKKKYKLLVAKSLALINIQYTPIYSAEY